MDNNKVCDVLRNEGLMPINEEIGITFKYEMLTYVIVKDEIDKGFFRMVLPNVYDLSDGDFATNRLKAIIAANEFNRMKKVAKAVVIEDSVHIEFQILLDKSPEYSFMSRAIRLLSESRFDFAQQFDLAKV